MATGGDACRTVHISTDIALVGQQRRPCVQANTHLDRAGCERLREGRGGLNRSWCRREGEEERVSLRVDLDAVVTRAGLADQAAVLGKRSRIALRSQFVQELRRSFDVGEEDGDCAGREVVSHAP
jgi:hypothetical protein